MDKRSIIIRHASFSFFGSILITALAFFLKFYLVHNFIDATLSFGVFALGVSMIEFIAPFSSMGFGGVATRYIPKWKIDDDSIKISGFLTFISLFSLISSLLYALLLYSHHTKIFQILGVEVGQNEFTAFFSFLPLFLVLMVVKNLASIGNQLLVGFQQVKKSVFFSDFIGFPLKFILVVILIYFGFDFKGYLYAEIISAIVILIGFSYFLSHIISKHYYFKISLDWLDKKVMIYAGTFFILGFLAKFSNLLDKWLIQEYMSIKNLGIYYMTFAFIEFLPFVLKSINKIFAPIISEIWEQKKLDELHELYRFFTKWTVLLSYPLLFFIIFFCDDLLLLFGSDFINGRFTLIILSMAHFFSISLGSVRTILQMTDHHIQVFQITLLKSVLVILLLFILVPKFQMEGAAFALAIGIIINNILNYMILYKKLALVPYSQSSWRVLMTILFSSSVLVLSFDYLAMFISHMYWYWLILFLLYAYIVTIISSRVLCFSEQDKLALKNLLNKKKE